MLTAILEQVALLLVIGVLLSALVVLPALLYFTRERTRITGNIARIEAESRALARIQQEYDWKTRVFEHTGKRPALPPMEHDPDDEIVPFRPMKRKVERQ